MLIGGEKWACEACVRGHRVSNCQHSDRPLQHINKKGRPVSQCQHCRSLRKSRSAHVRCDCSGEKAHGKGACVLNTASQANSCACSLGSRCTCALKKEPLDRLPVSDSDELPAVEKRRARTLTKTPETRLTIFTNGHHKPAQKHNNTAHNYGSPYPIPRTASLRGVSPTVVSHGCIENSSYNTANGIMKNEVAAQTLMNGDLQEKGPEKSEQKSPSSSSVSSTDIRDESHKCLNVLIPSDISWSKSLDSVSSIPDTEHSIFSAGLGSSSIDWSHYDGLTFNEGFGTSSFSHPPSYSGFDFSSVDQPALTTTSTSGELSEVEDFVPLAKNKSNILSSFNHKREPEKDALDFSGDIDNYRISAASSYMGLQQTHVLANNSDELDVFIKYTNTLNSHGIHTPTDDHSYASQISSPFNDSNFTLPSTAEEETEAHWMDSLSPVNTMVGASSTQGILHDDFWVQ